MRMRDARSHVLLCCLLTCAAWPSAVEANDTDSVLARCTPSGALDRAWSDDGVLIASTSGSDWITDLAFTEVPVSAGTLTEIMAGGAFETSAGMRVLLGRFKQDGSADTAYGWLGANTFDVPMRTPRHDSVSAIADAGAGRTYVAVTSTPFDGSRNRAYLTRVTANGALDAQTFARAQQGFVSPDPVPGATSLISAMRTTRDRRPVVVGNVSASTTAGRVFVARYTPDGALDPSFNAGAARLLSFGAAGDSLALAAAVDPLDDSIAVAGMLSVPGNSSVIGVLRLLADGRLDPQFNAGQPLVIDPPGSEMDQANGVIIDDAHRVLLTGSLTSLTHTGSLFVARLTTHGAVDTSFASAGWAKTNPPAATEAEGTQIARGPDGNFVIAGRAKVNSAFVTFFARYLGQDNLAGQLDRGFDGDGFAIVAPLSGLTNDVAALLVDGMGRPLLGGSVRR